MAEVKTKATKESVVSFINAVEPIQRRFDAKKLLEIFKEATGEKPVMWGSSIIGFGKYHYKSERSTQEADWFYAGFSPRKAAFSIYIMAGFSKYEKLLEKLGTFKKSSGCCLYIKKLDDIHVPTLKKLIKQSVAEVKRRHS